MSKQVTIETDRAMKVLFHTMNNDTNKQYVSLAEVAAWFNVSRSTISRWRESGCPCINININGKTFRGRYCIEDVEAWLLYQAYGYIPEKQA